MTLKELPVGKSGLITAVGGEGILRCRVLDMGAARGSCAADCWIWA